MNCSGCNMGFSMAHADNKLTCSSGCMRLNTADWLATLPQPKGNLACNVVEISFSEGRRKEFYRNADTVNLEKGKYVVVEGVNGFDIGVVSLTGEIVRLQLRKYKGNENDAEFKKILRNATEKDVVAMRVNKQKEATILIRSRQIAKELRLQMKISQVEVQADGRKVTFYYIADGRVDFRELIKKYASEFKMRIEMRQIGTRQETAKVGGIGACGRELCCSSWLTDFKSVGTIMARYQNLSINQAKLSGQCGRLKCCLNYELDSYLDALQYFPTNCDWLETKKGRASLAKKDVFKNIMWYVFSDSNKQYPITIEAAQKLRQLNAKGIIPDELELADVNNAKQTDESPKDEYVDVVGHFTLNALDKNKKKKKRKHKPKPATNQQFTQPSNNHTDRANPNNATTDKPNPKQHDKKFWSKKKK